MNSPPRRGPATDAKPNIAPIMPCNRGLLCRGTRFIIIIIPPEKIPAVPAPAMALPTMKTVEFGAAPQIAEPISKIAITDRYTFLGL